jgi:hypothetical protein
MLSPLPLAYVAHATQGRIRLRVPARQGETDYFSECTARLAEIEGVLAVRPRALTASLLIEHDSAFETIVERVRAAGLFAIAEVGADRGPPPAGRPLAPAIAGVLGVLAALQLFRNQVLPPALTLLWYAASLAREPQAPSASTASMRSQGRSRSRRPT